jgi:NACHT domain
MQRQQTVSQVFSLVCIAAPTDAPFLASWEKQLLPLQQTGQLSFWSERALQAGEERFKQLLVHINQADVIILFLSADFFASNECLILMDHALQRLRTGIGRVVPLLVRPVLWRESALRTFACLPANEVPVSTWENQDEGWHACVLSLQRLLGLRSSYAQRSFTGKRDHSDRGRLLRWLKQDYQRSLDESLEHLAWLELGLAEQPDAVRNAAHLLQHRPDRSEQALPANTSILDAYDQAEEALLILGNPGAGKSTLLRDLALQLITRAQRDDMHPLPVILPLSSWAVNKPELSDWLVEQLTRIYDVPRSLGQQWVQQSQLLPLLDGLDEMEEAARSLCIGAINAFRAANFTPLVVCSRSAEYQAASVRRRLVLQNAVVVQPLTPEQVQQAIRQGGKPLAGLREALRDSSELNDLATTPLMLSVLALAYHGVTVNDLPQQQMVLERRVWADYVERMVREKGAERQGKGDIPVKRYMLEQTHSWLSWLAQQMQEHNQAHFYGEDLTESWLDASPSRLAWWLLWSGSAIIVGALITVLLVLVFLGMPDTDVLIRWSIVGGFLGWYISQSTAGAQNSQNHLQRSRFLSSLLLGLLQMATWVVDPLKTSGSETISLLINACFIGSGAWMLQKRLALLQSPVPPISRPPTNFWSRITAWMRTTPGRQAISVGLLFGISDALSEGLSDGLFFRQIGVNLPNEALTGGLSSALGFGLPDGLNIGLIFGLSFWLLHIILRERLSTTYLTERIHWTGHALVQWSHLKASLLVALICLCFFGLSNGLETGLFRGLSEGLSLIGFGYGLKDGLIEGLSTGLRNGLVDGLSYGSSTGLGLGLSYWLLFGLYGGLRQEHLEVHDRRRFNQGLHRSFRNTLFLSLLSAGIVTGLAVLLNYMLQDGLNNGLQDVLGTLSLGSTDVPGFGLIDILSSGLRDLLDFGLHEGLQEGLNVIWIVTLCAWLVVWVAIGGQTILRHYMLRLLLAHSHAFPLHARRFLNDATSRGLLQRVGGGYGFVHRRLLDYFADEASRAL